ncbi:hypothetical protein HDU87_003270 [Geranomyces variabilis]|uniref:Uncharacterized protein n=1 Tax=Geranomyces variabilis TaxID=109894 RepID=A0AAD5XSU8_9FUNG|nr:hypothetical protein HDU87_003270 [Geranomyces variabilis]
MQRHNGLKPAPEILHHNPCDRVARYAGHANRRVNVRQPREQCTQRVERRGNAANVDASKQRGKQRVPVWGSVVGKRCCGGGGGSAIVVMAAGVCVAARRNEEDLLVEGCCQGDGKGVVKEKGREMTVCEGIEELKSVSQWTEEYLAALQHRFLDQVVVAHCVPQEYVTDRQAERNSNPSFFALTADSVRDWEQDDSDFAAEIAAARASPVATFYEQLHTVLLRGSQTSLMSTGTQKSDLSHTTEGDMAEKEAEDLLKILLSLFVSQEKFDSKDGRLIFKLRHGELSGNLDLFGMFATAINDGYINLRRQRSSRKYSDIGSLIIAFFEAKRLGHEITEASIFAQLAGESLYTAQLNQTGAGGGDQEAQSLGGEQVLIRKSLDYDLSSRSERLEFVAQVIGVLRYVASGNSFVGKMRATGLSSRLA